MNLEQLRTFREVAVRGGFGRAAQSLFLTQSAVSMQIASLERELGVRLFERLGRHIALTHAGEVLLRYATHIMTLVDESVRAMEDIRGAGSGSLGVGASATVGNYVVPPIIARFRAQRPGVQFSLEIAPTPEIAWRLVSGDLDVGLVEEQCAAPELVQRPFLTDELVLILPTGHRWANRDAVEPQDLATEPFVSHQPGSIVRQIIERQLGERGVELRPVLEVASPEAIKCAIRAGLGISIVSAHAVRLELSMGCLRTVPLRGVRLESQFYVVMHHGKHISPGLRAFLAAVDTYVAPPLVES